MTQQLLSINIKLVLVLNIQVRNIVHFLCVWSLMYPTRVLSSYLMCFSSLSCASLKFNSSIQVFPEALFLVTVVSFKNTCWFFASNSQWPFLLYSSPAPFKPAESFSLITSHFIFLLLLHFKCKTEQATTMATRRQHLAPKVACFRSFTGSLVCHKHFAALNLTKFL